jgi:hypothetical protein
MGDGRIFPKNLLASLFNDDLSNEPNVGRIHLASWTLWTVRLMYAGVAARLYPCVTLLM